ncbi:hypothetical protein OK351_09925 [Glutamicibacter sp. MNS18]|uniref:hypothetical protein n=1 Tax=Glutamicibacter sp. MNS18 TaxID=2989817 RepID=UPI0022357E92|nr:hypothetical protein [Glutamicibacter sp. MNS18]MCW4465821.1 hypothetical protein [Glutamicibacter sp. MNS18]
MSAQQPKPSVPEAAALLASARRAATQSAERTEAPRYLLTWVALVSAAIFSLHGIIDLTVWYWSLSAYVALGIWYWLSARKRPKARTVLRHSRRYILFMLLLMFVMQFGNFWVPETPWLVAAKFLVLLAVFWIAMWAMRSETIKTRLEDGHERSI